MGKVAEYMLELKSIVMLSQFGSKQVNLRDCVQQMEDSIKNSNNLDEEGEIIQLHRAYERVLGELVALED